MKQVLFIVLCCLLGASAAKADEPDYVVSGGQLYAFETVKVSPFSGFVGISKEGKQHFRFSEVESFRKNGKTAQKMPLVVNGKKTSRQTFMEPLASRSGMVLYRRSQYLDSKDKVDIYEIFNGENYVLTVEPSNSQNLSQFFSRK
ncbi:MAG: hypothetical protein R6U86_10315 [Bacteroidales bacterium]